MATTSSTARIRLATASPGTRATTKETLSQLRQIAGRAAGERADVLLLPEAYLGGYPRGADFGCKVGARTAEGREEYLGYFRAAVDLGDTVGNGAGAGDAWVKRKLGAHELNGESEGGPKRGDGTREELEAIARETGVFVVVGLVEKAGGSLYCAVVYVCPRLGIIGKRRKVMPTGTERLIWAQGSPATLKAVSTVIRGVRINLAAAICWENYMPLLRQSLYAQNINLYLAPTADGRDTWLPLMQTIALEGRCFVVSSNMCVREGDHHSPPAATSSATNGALDGAKNRRNSCLTEEGFEIALPSGKPPKGTASSSGEAAAAGPGAGGRRRSVFDEEGNEIVLGKDSAPAPASASVVENEEIALENTSPNPSHVKPLMVQSSTGFVCRGGSSIISPTGEVLAGPQWDDDSGSIIYTDVDFEDCVRGRLDLDAAGSYSRNDAFRFSVEGLELDPLPYF
ncbi:carbon-nitrogen hydrolase [Xylariaceae sp. FL0016]|nr:carbon-nitrogen hydrolase [Xylariaceae sp. FL0016]